MHFSIFGVLMGRSGFQSCVVGAWKMKEGKIEGRKD